ncbi:16S rRNA (guanine(966)-N(2))-methyltransferase RsmD [Clostridiales bacterium COT073_COT-073]|nr:16S rRNA (guanine(966)-N(2))-methyltransferase RsmD [Clostridiales bacterium COT073_COT-073]
MRVVAGSARGIPLKAPKGDTVRPTVDRLKETLFNIIQNEIYDRVILDVFAGSGALGIEALSRGASQAHFCEKNRAAMAVIEENLQKTRLTDKAITYFGDFSLGFQKMQMNGSKADLIFLDPPYHQTDLYQQAIELMLDKNILAAGALIVAEAKSDFDFSFLENYDTIKIEKHKRFKTNQYVFGRYQNEK